MKIITDFTLIAGILVNAAIIFILFKKRNRTLSQRLLIVFFSFLFLFLLNSYAEVHEIPILYVITFLFNDCIEFVIGPSIFFYVKSVFEGQRFKKINYLHYIPLLLYLVFVSVPILISFLQEKFIFSYLSFLNDNVDFAFLLMSVYLMVYALSALIIFLKYRSISAENLSDTNITDLGWIKIMLIGVIAIMTITIFVDIIDIFIVNLPDELDYITLFLVVFFVFYLGYYGIRQSQILIPDFLLDNLKIDNEVGESVNYLSSMSNLEIESVKNRLEEILLNEKPYLNEDFTLTKFADLVSISNKKLSTILNQHMNTSFYDLINSYRVESVKEKINSRAYDNYTLLGVAYESGFKSKTSFNRIFKKETGLSPSEYKKSL